jgi:hypothetical protein
MIYVLQPIECLTPLALVPGIFVNSVDISHMPKLRSLDLDFLTSSTKIQRPGIESSVIWKFLRDIESVQMNSTMDIEELTLRAPEYVLRNELSSSFWKNVSEILDGPGFKYFRNIHIVVGKCDVRKGRDAVEKWIRDQLGGCQSRGILRVTFENP